MDSESSNFLTRFKEIRIGEKFRILYNIGLGTFGGVYLGENIYTGEEVALKLEHPHVDSSLEKEVNVYRSISGAPSFPQVYWDSIKDDFTVMVFEALGPNLMDLLIYCGHKFSLKTTLLIATQLLSHFQTIHSRGYIHRDIKPENFLMGLGKHGNTVYMTDLGISVPYDPKHARLAVASDCHGYLVGTCRYASIHGHLGAAQSPCDDLEALGYMLVYFTQGTLPWQGLRGATLEEIAQRVLIKKQNTKIEELCHGLPTEFAIYMHYLNRLKPDEMPDYRYLRKLFDKTFRRHKFQYDSIFDWTLLEYQRLSSP